MWAIVDSLDSNRKIGPDEFKAIRHEFYDIRRLVNRVLEYEPFLLYRFRLHDSCCFSKTSKHAKPDAVDRFMVELKSRARKSSTKSPTVSSCTVLACAIRKMNRDPECLLKSKDRFQEPFWENQAEFISAASEFDQNLGIGPISLTVNILLTLENLEYSMCAVRVQDIWRIDGAEQVDGRHQTLEELQTMESTMLELVEKPDASQDALDFFGQCLVNVKGIISHISNGANGYTALDLLDGKELKYCKCSALFVTKYIANE